MEIFFETKKLTKFFGSIKAVYNVDLKLKKGEIVGLIGPNGAGKTTFLNIITGVHPPTSGKIIFKNRNITNLKPHKICRLGIVKTSQIPNPFLNLTLIENVFLAATYGGGSSKKQALIKSEKILEFVGLKENKDKLASQLNISERRRLELARALATNPEILLLDESMAGLTLNEIEIMMKLIKEINKSGVAVIFVEHIIKIVLKLANRLIFFNNGEKILEGDPEIVINSKIVKKAYFGE